jgi:putative transposase
MTRRRSPRVTQRDEELLPRIQGLKAEHPFWGSRRIWAYLRFVDQVPVNQKRLLRLRREHRLLVTANQRLRAKRTPPGRNPQPTTPNEWWGIDMTKVLVGDFGWSSIVVVLDWYTTTSVGYDAGLQCTARHWLAALAMAVKRQFPDGARDRGLSLMSDNGCQPASMAFMATCSTLGLHHALTSSNHPQGNADPARVIRTLQEACLWLQAWSGPFQVISPLASWIADDHEHELHSALGDKTPRPYARDYHSRHRPPCAAA